MMDPSCLQNLNAKAFIEIINKTLFGYKMCSVLLSFAIFSLLAFPITCNEQNSSSNQNGKLPTEKSVINVNDKAFLDTRLNGRGVAGKNDIDVNTVIMPASFDRNYSESVNISSRMMFIFNYTLTNQTTAVRVRVMNDRAGSTHPVMFSATQQETILSWSVPLAQNEIFSHTTVSRTLCPVNKVNREHLDNQQFIFLEASSHSPTSIMFHLNVNLVQDFQLSHNKIREESVAIAQPEYYVYMFPDDVDQVLLRVTSESKTCMIVSVQEIECPVKVRYLENNIEFEGKHQTMTTQSAIFLQRSDFENIKGFYLVLLVLPKDDHCSGKVDIEPAQEVKDRSKMVKIIIEDTTTTKQYIIATLSAVAVFLGFYIYWPLYSWCWSRRCKRCKDSDDSTKGEAAPILNVNRQAHETNSQVDTFSMEDDSCNSKEESKSSQTVSDLSKIEWAEMRKYYCQYFYNLVPLAIFYAIPVVQLVFTYQRELHQSGNQDLCYYNFDCANPLTSYLGSFNNFFSNIGYVLMGILFILIVRTRDNLNARAFMKYGDRERKTGIPQHYGIFYAMGFALVMEGVMSASYHVCPSLTNFQFDTSFMYMMACLCILRIYQNRHTDITARSHITYISMACITFIAVLGVVFNSNIFWILYALFHMFISTLISAQVYFQSKWEEGCPLRKWFAQFFGMCVSWDPHFILRWSSPESPYRFILLLGGTIINWFIVLYGAIHTSAFALQLLIIFIVNMGLYCLYYIIMKFIKKEKISWEVGGIIGTAAVLWGVSLYFFTQHLTEWKKTPSASREGNRDCILFDFYDSHDVWHFLSAFSLFFSFVTLLLMDDNISDTAQEKIETF